MKPWFETLTYCITCFALGLLIALLIALKQAQVDAIEAGHATRTAEGAFQWLPKCAK
jgi:hypothetical protein